MTLNVPADGATWRMEATKRDDGTRTAVALENCKGLTPGYINAFWLEKGPPEYDFACREVIGAFDPKGFYIPAADGRRYVRATVDFPWPPWTYDPR